MTHMPGGHRRPPDGTGRAGRYDRAAGRGRGRLWGLPGWALGAAAAGGLTVVVAVAVGLSQATAAPACAAVIRPQAPVNPQAPAHPPEPAAWQAPAASQVPDAPRAAAAVLASAAGGEATHYVLAPGTGNCSYPGLPAGQLYAALSPAEYDSGAACGSYVQVSGPDGSVTAEVVDQCPPCGTGHIDLSEAAFARIAPLGDGLVSVSYRTLANPPLPGPLSVLVKTGSSAYYLALLPMNTGNALASVQASGPGRGWQPLSRASYGYWLAPAGLGPGPFTLRLTDSQGHQATLAGITLSPGTVQATRTWMYSGAAAGPAAPAPGTAAASPPHAAGRASAAPARKARHRRRPVATAVSSPAGSPAAHHAPARAPASPTPTC
jgi:expansin